MINYIKKTTDIEYVLLGDFFDIELKNYHNYVFIGNPPFGIKDFSKDLQKEYKTKESFEAFLIKLSRVDNKQWVILPESLLYRERYKSIRSKLSQNYVIHITTDLKFNDIAMGIVMLELTKGKTGTFINKNDVDLTNTNIWYDYTKGDIKFMKDFKEKHPNKLGDMIDHYMMGIVTGNNKKHITNTGNTPIYRKASLLNKDKLEYFNIEDLDKFQQVSKFVLDEPKIVYGFVGLKPFFHYDIDGVFISNALNSFILKDKTKYEEIIKYLDEEDIQKYMRLTKGGRLQYLKLDIEHLPY